MHISWLNFVKTVLAMRMPITNTQNHKRCAPCYFKAAAAVWTTKLIGGGGSLTAV